VELARVEVWVLSWWGGSSRRAAHYAGQLGSHPLSEFSGGRGLLKKQADCEVRIDIMLLISQKYLRNRSALIV
jgi:hypothetical protein